jgi:hypothetical protein
VGGGRVAKGPPLVTLSEFDGVRAGHEPETAQSNSRWTLTHQLDVDTYEGTKVLFR